MKERPILFKADMVRAILNTRPGVWPAEPIDVKKPFKWQTRRVMKPQQENCFLMNIERDPIMVWRPSTSTKKGDWIEGPYQRGMHLWARETWSYITKAKNEYHDKVRPDGCPVEMLYRASLDYEIPAPWTPSIFMPRWASRFDLEIKGIRVERVQDISDADILAEGFPEDPPSYSEGFAGLWDSINAKRGYPWAANPWVWVVEFMRLR